MFYTFEQNNVFGFFTEPAIYVCVEADSASEANEIAQRYGVYFNSSLEPECECCGDRWTPYNHGAMGTEFPEVYGKPIIDQEMFYMIIYKDGTVVRGGSKNTWW
jgi:hypothetical protein